MFGQGAFGVNPRTEGVPVSGVYYNRASSIVSGNERGLYGGIGGVSIGRFGWAASDGSVLNSRTNADDVLGLVVVQGGDWRRIYWDTVTHTWKIRQGMNLTMLSAAPGMWVRLDGGGAWGDRIYTDPVDGRPIAGYALELEATPWTVGLPVGAGGLSLITTWNTPNG